MALNNLQDLYVEQLQDLYSAETQLVKALPQMADTATNPELKEAFQMHLGQTEEHVQRLEQVFNNLSKDPKGHHCKGMEGLLKEGQEMIREKGEANVRDAGLIAAAQRVEHYEIAGYGTVRTYAERLGRQDDLNLLQRTLDEEGEADHKLTRIAEQVVNPEAMR